MTYWAKGLKHPIDPIPSNKPSDKEYHDHSFRTIPDPRTTTGVATITLGDLTTIGETTKDTTPLMHLNQWLTNLLPWMLTELECNEEEEEDSIEADS